MRLFCSICKDVFIPASEVHVTNCGHLYHASCLGTWLQRRKTCPQCRTVLASPIRVFFDVDNEGGVDPNTLEHELENAKDRLQEMEALNKDLLERNEDFEKVVAELKESEKTLNTKNGLLKTTILALKDKVKKLLQKAEEIKSLEGEVQKWKLKANGLENLNLLMKSTAQEVSDMLESTPVTPLSVKHLCTYVAVLKNQLQKIETKNVELKKENMEFRKNVNEEKIKNNWETEEIIRDLRLRNKFLKEDLSTLKSMLKEKRERVQKCTEEEHVGLIKAGSSTNLSINRLDLSDDENDKNKKCLEMNNPREGENIINNWEELVCAGPSRMSLKSRSFTSGLNTTAGSPESTGDVSNGADGTSAPSAPDKEADEAFAYDGMGGRKKIRLGGPTPVEEFQKIKRIKKEKALGPVCQHRKIIDYYPRN